MCFDRSAPKMFVNRDRLYPAIRLATPFFLADIARQLDRIIFGNAVEGDPDVDLILPILIYLFPPVPDPDSNQNKENQKLTILMSPQDPCHNLNISQ
jgi:hypothetical protein